MQYILTKQEYEELLDKKQKVVAQEAKDLQDFCTMVANTLPIKRHWDPKNKAPWGCILTKSQEWYCDECPAKNVCPNPYKEWSK